MDIEQDALVNTPDASIILAHEHTHEVKSFIATPRMDQGIVQKFMTWMKSGMKPGIFITQKDEQSPRRMFLITSNSYEDREKETITSKALQAYEDSCFPGEDLYHNDNDLVWWHDDDVVMGDLIAVNYSTPFLIEVAQERLDSPVSKVLFDWAEKNGDLAGVSHKFGYLEGDRSEDGTYERIFKQETSYLPRRDLAANMGTYAEVIGSMASKQSDAWLDKIFEEVGVTGAAEKIHAKTGELEKELAAKGVTHKAFPPAANAPAKKPAPKPTTATQPVPPVEADAAAVADDNAAMADDNAAEQMDAPPIVEEVPVADGKVDMTRMMVLLNGVMNMFQDMLDSQAMLEMDRVGMMKSLDEIKELRMSEKAAEKVTMEGLEAKMKALQEDNEALKARLSSAEKKLNLAPRAAHQQTPIDPKAIGAIVEQAEKDRAEGDMIDDPFWGKLKPLPK